MRDPLVVAVGVPVVVFLAVALAGCAFGSFDDLTEKGSARPSPERCGECHQQVFEEWSSSAHARAYDSPRFTAYTSDHSFGGCLPCHAPDSLYTEGEIETREVDPHRGVDCVACHLDGDALVGPLPSSAVYSPHDIREDHESYRKSDMCGRCHEGTFRQWRSSRDLAPAGDHRECQECHMPRVTRTVTQAHDAVGSFFVAMEKEQVQRQHRFDLEAMQGFDDAADLRATVVPAGLAVEVTNHLPHALPTGDYGPTRIEARIAFLGADGTSAGRATASWSPRLSKSIPAFGHDRRVVPIPPSAVGCEVVLVRPGNGQDRELVLARTKSEFR